MSHCCIAYKTMQAGAHALTWYRYNAGSFFANWAAVLLSLLTAQSIGLLVGSVVTHPKTGQTIATITALTMILVRAALSPLHVFFFPLAVGCAL